jgi:HK97 family phage prohead protease
MEHKTLSLIDCEIKLEDSGIFAGYASTFNNVDSYGDTILPGAYIETLRKNGLPKMFILHRSYELPIGKWLDAAEDKKGLYVKGELTPGMSMSNDVGAALKHGTLDGLSIGYALKKGDYTPSEVAEGGRIIKKVSLLDEISPVTYPADRHARVDTVSLKSEVDGIETVRDFERFLRDAGGLSKGLTEALVSRAKIVFYQGEPGQDKIDAKALQMLTERLQKFTVANPDLNLTTSQGEIA